jgi:porphobilinogen deaminase
MLEDQKSNPDVAAILTDMNQLKAIYEKITVTTSEISTSKDEETQVTTLKSGTKNNFTLELFAELSAKVEAIRESYIL